MKSNNPNHRDNLRPFKPGEDPRRNKEGRPKGSKNWSTVIRNILDDPEILDKIIESLPKSKRPNLDLLDDKTPAYVIGIVLTLKSLTGDVKAANFLRKTAYGDKIIFEDEEGKSIKPMLIIDLSNKPKAKPKRKVTSAKKAASNKPKAKRSSRSSKKS